MTDHKWQNGSNERSENVFSCQPIFLHTHAHTHLHIHVRIYTDAPVRTLKTQWPSKLAYLVYVCCTSNSPWLYLWYTGFVCSDRNAHLMSVLKCKYIASYTCMLLIRRGRSNDITSSTASILSSEIRIFISQQVPANIVCSCQQRIGTIWPSATFYQRTS